MSEEMNSTQPQFNFPFGFNVVDLDFQGNKIPFAYRPDTIDENVIQNVFQNEEYLLPIEDFQPKLILDCGGNIGCSALYFSSIYPDAQIYTVEPEKNNFKLLTFNTCMYDNIHAINSELWDKETFVKVQEDNSKDAGLIMVETTEDDDAAINTTTISKILKDSGLEEIDILKVDIAGAEKEVFSAPDVDEWLSKVNIIIIKLNDGVKRDCSYEFFKAVSKYHWYFTQRGENVILLSEKILDNFD